MSSLSRRSRKGRERRRRKSGRREGSWRRERKEEESVESKVTPVRLTMSTPQLATFLRTRLHPSHPTHLRESRQD